MPRRKELGRYPSGYFEIAWRGEQEGQFRIPCRDEKQAATKRIDIQNFMRGVRDIYEKGGEDGVVAEVNKQFYEGGISGLQAKQLVRFAHRFRVKIEGTVLVVEDIDRDDFNEAISVSIYGKTKKQREVEAAEAQMARLRGMGLVKGEEQSSPPPVPGASPPELNEVAERFSTEVPKWLK